MKNKLMMAVLFVIASLAACRKQNSVMETTPGEIRASTPGSLTPGGPYPNPVEWAFGNALQPGMPCDIAFATCGVWQPTFPFPGAMNRLTSAPASLSATGASDLQVIIDGTQLSPAIKTQAVAGAPFVLDHNTALPQSAVASAFAAAGQQGPSEVVIPAGSYNTSIDSNPGDPQALIIVRVNIAFYYWDSRGDNWFVRISLIIIF